MKREGHPFITTEPQILEKSKFFFNKCKFLFNPWCMDNLHVGLLHYADDIALCVRVRPFLEWRCNLPANVQWQISHLLYRYCEHRCCVLVGRPHPLSRNGSSTACTVRLGTASPMSPVWARAGFSNQRFACVISSCTACSQWSAFAYTVHYLTELR